MIVANQILINDKNVKYDAPKTAKLRAMRTTAIVWIPTKHKPETTFRRQK